MSYFVAKIVEIESLESLHRVRLSAKDHNFSMISLELHENVQVDTEVKLSVKPSNVVISKCYHKDITIANQLLTKIDSIEFGKILTNVKLDFLGYSLEGLITTHTAKQLNLQKGDRVYAFINESDLSLSPMEQ